MRAHHKAIVIGGGVIGASSAYYLALDGWEVRIIERETFGHTFDRTTNGIVSQSQILPVMKPSAVKQAVEWLRGGDSPFHSRPSLDVELFSWAVNTVRRRSKRHLCEVAEARRSLMDQSRLLYDALIEDDDFLCKWESRGCLLTFAKDKEFERYRQMLPSLIDGGLTVDCYDSEELQAFEPALRSGLAGGIYYPREVALGPDKLMRSMRAILQRMGVQIEEHSRIKDLCWNNDRLVSVETNNGTRSAHIFVVAAGVWTPQLSALTGADVPIRLAGGHSLTMARPVVRPTHTCFLHEARTLATPSSRGYRLYGTLDTGDVERATMDAQLAGIGRDYFRDHAGSPQEGRATGWRPVTADGLPVIDWSRRFENTIIASGHNNLGISMAPATGQLVAQLVHGRTPIVDPTPFSLNRFDDPAATSAFEPRDFT